MNKETDKLELSNHSIKIIERQSIFISGIVKISSFDSEEFLLDTTLGTLGIKGKDLEIIKLDTYEGTIMIKGIIDAISYLDITNSKKENNMLSKLFK